MEGPDHKASLNPKEFTKFVKKIREAEKIMGLSKKFCVSEEKEMKKSFKKKYCFKKTINKNNKLSPNNITCKRPGTGIVANNF